jgi:hypothetical protein
VADPLRDFVTTLGAWTGTATDLLETLTKPVGPTVNRNREWPRTPTALGGHLRRLAPTLRTFGVEVLFHRDARQRTITLQAVKPGYPRHQRHRQGHPHHERHPLLVRICRRAS